MVVAMVQAIYAKAIKISWKDQELFQDLVLRLGTFHTTGVLLAVIGQRFGAAGLRDIVIESKVIVEGSVEKTINRNHYNRAARFHKLMFEACMRLIWESFLNWMSQSEINDVAVNQALDRINKLINQEEVNETLFESVWSDQAVADLFKSFQDFCQLLRESNGTLSRFWMSCMELVTILLNLIRASREGNWPFHLSSIKEMIPWCFTYNRVNYSPYLPWYYRQMQSLPHNTSRSSREFSEWWIFLLNWKQKHVW